MHSVPFRNSDSRLSPCKPVEIHSSHDELHFSLLSAARKNIRIKLQSALLRLLSAHWGSYPHHDHYDRKDIKQGLKTILTAIEKVKSGISICIFPEGTRNANADELELLPFHEGSFKIASKSGCAIIPMAMNNTAEIFEAHMPKIKSTHVVLEYGKPIYVKELSREDQKHLGVYTQNVIHEMLEKNQKLV